MRPIVRHPITRFSRSLRADLRAAVPNLDPAWIDDLERAVATIQARRREVVARCHVADAKTRPTLQRVSKAAVRLDRAFGSATGLAAVYLDVEQWRRQLAALQARIERFKFRPGRPATKLSPEGRQIADCAAHVLAFAGLQITQSADGALASVLETLFEALGEKREHLTDVLKVVVPRARLAAGLPVRRVSHRRRLVKKDKPTPK